jgi:malate dehydrogenase (oxaloacetate-decarboxylating)(NADP+)
MDKGKNLFRPEKDTSGGKRGIDVIRDPEINKSTAFSEMEREALGLNGLLPSGIDTMEIQVRRVMKHLDTKATDLGRYIYLTGLHDTDETLFYKVLMSDPVRFLPIVYAPTVGEACLKFGHIFRRPRGMYLSIRHKGRVREVLRNWPGKGVRVICVSSGGRVLGLGDLGANGMGIPIGKLHLYTACAAVPPHVLLPMHIDCGTANRELIEDPLYLGLRQPRIPADELDEFMDEFVSAVQEEFPDCCIHFEDWAGVDAMRLLTRYRDRACCFNDDIQGTAAMVLAGMLSALRVAGGRLGGQKILIMGAGSAGIGIADLLAMAMAREGLSMEQARSRISLFDVNGLIESGRTDLLDFQKPYAHPHAPSRDFLASVESLAPTAIIGVSTRGGAFTRQVIEAMARINRRPVIFALSNPTDRAECTAEEAYLWSEGKALYAAGVPFPPVRVSERTLVPGQGNNMYIFPAIGLAVFATKAKRVTDEMFIAAARGVAEQVSPAGLDAGSLYPSQSDILDVEIATAVSICEVIFEQGLSEIVKPGDIRTFLESMLYTPEYRSMI